MHKQLELLYKSAPLYRELFTEQLEFALCPSRFVAAVCSARAGKTTVCAAIAIQKLIDRPNSMGLYLALTDRSVPDIFLPVVKDLLSKYKITAQINRDEVIFPNGSKLLLAGADHDKKIESFRGVKLLYCIIDEAASFSTKRLEYLIDQVIGLRLSDLRGTLYMIGTPANHCSGLFHKVTTSDDDVWVTKRWTAFDNPHQSIQHKESAELYLKRKKCDTSNPGYRREFLGEWRADDEALIVKTFHVATPSIQYNPDQWRTVIGCDLGFDDMTAFSVIGWQHKNRKSYVLETTGYTKLGVSQIVNKLKELKDKYKPITIVIPPDTGGKMLIEEFSTRYKIFCEQAQKSNKAHYIELMNDALLNEELVLLPHTTKPLQHEMRHLVWNEDRTREMEGRECDHFDATLYAYRSARAYTEKIPQVAEVDPKQAEKDMFRRVVEMDRAAANSRNGDDFFSDFID